MVIGHNMDDVEPDDGEAGWVGQRGEPRCKLLPSGAIPNPRGCAHTMTRSREHARDHLDEASP